MYCGFRKKRVRFLALLHVVCVSLIKYVSIKSVVPSNHLILCHPCLFLPSIFPSIRVFSGESVLELIKINNFLKRKQLEGYNQRNNLRKFPELVDEFLERRGPVH